MTQFLHPSGRPARIAVLYDHVLTVGGAEQVFLYMLEAFPEADYFALSYNPEKAFQEYRQFKLNTSWANRIFSTHRRFQLLFPFASLVMQFWNIGRYDILLSACATTAKYTKLRSGRHVCYCFFPTRAIWNAKGYFKGGLVARVFHMLLPILRRRDVAASKKVDRFVAISQTAQAEIEKVYGRESEVLFSPIPVARFRTGLSEEKRDFFLLVSRLENWKRVDYAIEAFNRLGLPLRIIGTGEAEARLKVMAGPNIEFMGRQSMDEVVRQYGQARAVIFTPALEYGLVPIEAVAAGTPAIALGFGGVKETMIGLEEAEAKGVPPTAVFFDEQTPESLMEAVKKFEGLSFDRHTLSAHADKFDIPFFQERLRQIVREELAREAD